MKKNKNPLHHLRLTVLFTLMVFIVMFVAFSLVFTFSVLLTQFKIINMAEYSHAPLFLFALVSLIVGTIFSLLFSRRPLKPLNDIMDAADKIADGDYSVRVTPQGNDEFRQLGEKFNHMVEEIGSVEMMRNDFVNNFSHEFKTPIVSIRGFAKMLKCDDLTADERNEYLDIIISESERLTELATNVLNLSKIEQQTILTNKKIINISEQIRLAIALLDSKWSEKDLEIIFDCEEYFVSGNEELLKQVWINLLDNAIKFSPEHVHIEINIHHENERLHISFQNESPDLTEESLAHLFDKFYQADTSHTTKGNGLGLALVKKIVELHDGEVLVNIMKPNSIIFNVLL